MIRNIQAAALSCVLVSALAACGESEVGDVKNATTASTGGEASATTSGSGGFGGATSTSAGNGGSGGATSTTTSASSGETGGGPIGYARGSIFITSGASSKAVPHSYEVWASFVSAPDGSPGTVTKTSVGDCVIQAYSTPPFMGTETSQSAGTITVSGGSVPVSLMPNQNDEYPILYDDMNDLFSGGETIEVTATGAAVPAFTATALAPAPIDLISPAQPPNDGPLLVDRTKDLVFTWKGGGAGSVGAIFADEAGDVVTCTFPSAAGTGTVPKAALAALSPSSKGAFGISPGSIQTVTAGDFEIDIGVTSWLTWNGVVGADTSTYEALN